MAAWHLAHASSPTYPFASGLATGELADWATQPAEVKASNIASAAGLSPLKKNVTSNSPGSPANGPVPLPYFTNVNRVRLRRTDGCIDSMTERLRSVGRSFRHLFNLFQVLASQLVVGIDAKG